MKKLSQIKKWLFGETKTPKYVFNCMNLIWVSSIHSEFIKGYEHSRHMVYFYIYFQGLTLKVYYLDINKNPELLNNIRNAFINSIGHSYLAIYDTDLNINGIKIYIEHVKS